MINNEIVYIALNHVSKIFLRFNDRNIHFGFHIFFFNFRAVLIKAYTTFFYKILYTQLHIIFANKTCMILENYIFTKWLFQIIDRFINGICKLHFQA